MINSDSILTTSSTVQPLLSNDNTRKNVNATCAISPFTNNVRGLVFDTITKLILLMKSIQYSAMLILSITLSLSLIFKYEFRDSENVYIISSIIVLILHLLARIIHYFYTSQICNLRDDQLQVLDKKSSNPPITQLRLYL